MDIKTSDISKVMSMLDKMRTNMAACFIGPPGIGKTQGIYTWAEEHGRNVVTIIASQCLPSEVAGFVMPGKDNEHSVIYDPKRLADLKDGDVLFFDELLTAPTPVLSACLTFIQERTLMSGKKLADVIIVAAANPLGAAAQIPLPVRQRFMFMHVGWDKKEWCKYIREQYHVGVPKCILDKIELEGDSYNVFTPRSATKIIEMLSKIDTSIEDEIESAKLIIAATFDDPLFLKECINFYCEKKTNTTAEELIIKHVDELLSEDERKEKLLQALKTCDITECFGILKEYLTEDEMRKIEEMTSKYDENDYI